MKRCHQNDIFFCSYDKMRLTNEWGMKMLYWTILGIWIFLEVMLVLKIVIGIVYYKFTPRRNGWIGFRTNKTLSSDKLWRMANVEFGKLFIFFGTIESVASLLTLTFTYQGFVNVDEVYIPLIYLFVYICTAITVVVMVIKKIENVD